MSLFVLKSIYTCMCRKKIEDITPKYLSEGENCGNLSDILKYFCILYNVHIFYLGRVSAIFYLF